VLASSASDRQHSRVVMRTSRVWMGLKLRLQLLQGLMLHLQLQAWAR
jgi:hypothetical protein